MEDDLSDSNRQTPRLGPYFLKCQVYCFPFLLISSIRHLRDKNFQRKVVAVFSVPIAFPGRSTSTYLCIYCCFVVRQYEILLVIFEMVSRNLESLSR